MNRYLSIAVLVLVCSLALFLVADPSGGPNPVTVTPDSHDVMAKEPITGTAMTTGEPPVIVHLIVNGTVVREDNYQENPEGTLNSFRFPTNTSMAGKIVEVVAIDADGNSHKVTIIVSE